MNADRFRDLADAWGGDIRRWPTDERDAARAWLEVRPVEGEAILSDARRLDTTLQAAPRPVVSAALRDRVLASARAAGLRAGQSWPGLRKLLWLGGIGWATAACAGVAFGMSYTDRLAHQSQALAVFDQARTGLLDDEAILG